MLLYYLVIVFRCLYSEATLRILGSRDAIQDEFPYAVRLENWIPVDDGKQKYIYFGQFCTGAAVTSTWILTAGHCLPLDSSYEDENIKLFARYNSHFPQNKGQLSLILEHRAHPNYNGNHVANDVGLFRCEKILVYVYAPISAVNYRSLVGHEALVLGYGATNSSEVEKPLQVLKGMLNKCLQKDPISKLMMCLVPPCGLLATICGGDSGGPVLHATGLVGVNSKSQDNCDEYTEHLKRTPGTSASVIAMLSPHLNWIYNTIRNKTSN